MEEKVLTRHFDAEGVTRLEAYRRLGGYTAVEKALKKMTPAEVMEEVKKASLRG